MPNSHYSNTVFTLSKYRHSHLRADVIQDAGAAFGFAGDADRAAVGDHEVREEDPVLFGDKLFEVAFDLDGIRVCGEAEAVTEAANMRVHDDTARDAVGVSQDYIRGLASDTAERKDLVHSVRDFAMIGVDDAGARCLDIPGLVAEESRRVDVVFELLLSDL